MGCTNSKPWAVAEPAHASGLPSSRVALKRAPTLAPEDLHEITHDDERRLLLISDQLPKYHYLTAAVKPTIATLVVHEKFWALDDLTNAIQNLAGEPMKQFSSVGLLDHGTYGKFNLLESVGVNGIDIHDVEQQPQLQEFFKFLAGYVRAPKELHKWRQDLNSRIDLMACCVAGNEKGMRLIQYLEDLTHVNWAASVDKTGNIADGGNWVMETEPGLEPVNHCYFYQEKLDDWHETAFIGTLAYGVASGAGSLLEGKPLSALNDVASGVTDAALVVASPVATVASRASQVVAGGGRLVLTNDTELPMLVSFANTGGAFYESPVEVYPKKKCCCDWSVLNVRKVVYIMFDGKVWRWVAFLVDREGDNPVKATSIVYGKYEICEKLGVDVGAALTSAMSMAADLGMAVVKFVKEKIQNLLEGIKHLVKQSGIYDLLKQLQDFFGKQMPKKPTGEIKRPAAQDVDRNLTNGKAIFKSYHIARGSKDNPIWACHDEVHKLRGATEVIRFAFLDVGETAGIILKIVDAPKDIKTLIGDYQAGIDAVLQVSRKFNAGGPIASTVKELLEYGLTAFRRSLEVADTSMDPLDAALKPMRKQIETGQKNLREVLPVNNLEFANQKLAKLEKVTGTASESWSQINEATEIKDVKGAMKGASQKLRTLNNQMKPISDKCKSISAVVQTGNYVAQLKDFILTIAKIPLKLLDIIKTVSQMIWDHVIKKILDLPIVKQVMAFVNQCLEWLTDQVMKLCQLDKLKDLLGEKLNPFSTFKKVFNEMRALTKQIGDAFDPNIYQKASKQIAALSSGVDAVNAIIDIDPIQKAKSAQP